MSKGKDGRGTGGGDKDNEDDNKRAEIARKGSPFLDTAQAAHFLGMAHRTLESMRWKNKGPVFRRHGRKVRYHINDLMDWSKGRSPADPA